MYDRSAAEGEALLLSVLPLITASTSLVGSDQSLYALNFWTLFCAEAQILQSCLIDDETKIDRKSTFYLDTLEQILLLFESLVNESVLSPVDVSLRVQKFDHKKLNALRSRNQSSNDATDLQQYLCIPQSHSQCRDILWALTTHSKDLSSEEDSLPSWWSQEKEHRSSPAYEVRESAITLYHTLSEKWPGCGKATHLAKLCLTRYRAFESTVSQVEFDLLFSTHNPKWQESKISVSIAEQERPASKVRFQEPPSKKRVTPQQLAKDICGLIENTSKRKTCLHLLVDDDRKLWHTLAPAPSRKPASINAHETLSMKHIIEKSQEERLQGSSFKKSAILSLKERRIIAVLLAHCLLQFCGSAWLEEHWSKESIAFFQRADGDRIVLSTGLKEHATKSDEDAPYRFHHYPGILALGILLLEMELKKTIETARNESLDDFDQDEEPNLNTDLETALKMFDDVQDNALPGFKAAVDACLTFDYFKEDTEIADLVYHRDKLYDDMALRRKIYQDIIAPLERELCMSFPEIQLDELSQMPLKFSFWERMEDRTTNDIHRNENRSPGPTRLPRSPPPTGPSQPNELTIAEAIPRPVIPIHMSQPVFFHDVPVEASKESQRKSKDWFRTYMNALEDLIDRIDYSPNFESSKVKVAILDTGVDLEDSFIRGAKDRIRDCKNWADDREDLDEHHQVHDASGHGTHVAALLLKTAPEADVYIGRIADQNGCMISPEKISEVIKYATDVWGVDIITMSFGFRSRINAINQAIKDAFSKDVIMFAATSNDGGNEEVAFPAVENAMVIGINSTNVWGDKSNFTPNTLSRSENFSILGEAIESSWPKHLGQGSRQCKSGTSYATPIAAGTAASMLFYSRMKLQKQEKVAELRSCAGMRKMLLSMSEMRDGYNYIRPWVLWRKDDEYIAAHILTTLG